MSGAWVAGTVRARALGRRRVGRTGARALAACGSLDDALDALTGTPYRHDVRVGSTLAQAQHQVADSLLWNLRVLAGWLPRPGGDALRLLAAGFEIADVDELLRSMAQASAEPPYRLGTLATAWPGLQGAASPGELRERLARSPWGDPGGDTGWEVQLGMRLVWADRVAADVPPATRWAAGAAALLVAREVVGRGRGLPDRPCAVVRRLLGPAAAAAADVGGLARSLPVTARWALDGVGSTADLWRAETAYWSRVEDDAFALARSSHFGIEPVVGAVALLAVDAWRVRAALELAARGAADGEVLDAVV